MKNILKRFKLPLGVALVYIALFIFAPSTAQSSSRVTWEYFLEMVFILPPVFILMGLMEVWLPKDKIQKWLGNDSGIRGGIFSLALGTLPTGPLYVAFPLAASLLHKGASVTNVVIFLGSWAALKIPQLMVEVKFLGWGFALTRFILTTIALVIMGLVMKLALRTFPDKKWLEETKALSE
ncbi:MAG TPA: permease [Sphaerochaeta sp.]|nr:permease [Sphaerochaeta sp.]